MNFVILFFIAAIIFVVIYYIRSNSYTANEHEFKQAGVRVQFKEEKITINGRTYNVNEVQGLEIQQRGNASYVIINIDDFNKPVHKIGVSGRGNGEKLMQRLSTALRKAGGPSFY